MSAAIVMALYRGDRLSFFEQALNSVLHARGIDRVLVGVDGPVPEGMNAFLQAQMQQGGKLQVHWYGQNRGLAFVLNDLIDEALLDADCQYVFRMDADDVSLPHRFEAQHRYMNAHPDVAVSGGGVVVIDELGKPRGELFKADQDQVLKSRLPYDSAFIHPSVVFRASVLRGGIRYPTHTDKFEDVALWSELALKGYRFGNLPETVLQFRTSVNQLGRRTGVRKCWSELKVRFRYWRKAMPLRVDILAMVMAIFVFKVAFPRRLLQIAVAGRTKLLGQNVPGWHGNKHG